MQKERRESIALRLLRQLHGPQATFKSPQQEEATVHSIFSEEGFLCVLPTGGGKSSIFMLTALFSPERITAVLVPTIAVQNDIHRRASESGVKVSI